MQLLKDKGWKMFYSCMCGGSRKEYWSNDSFPGYEIRTRPRKQTFEIRSKNTRVLGPDFAYKLEDVLKKFEIYEPVQKERQNPV